MIEFEAVGKTFRDGTAAVVDLNLTVPSDKITVIVGPSGCGKTTTLRMINRMLEPTAGRILWDGTPLRSKRKTSLRRQMGYVIQSGGLFPHRTILENVGTVPSLLNWDHAKIRKRSLQVLDSVGLDRKLALRYPAQLSGGQQQRVGVARALAADPMVLLMDEPFSAVDPVVRADLHELLLGLQRELSKTIVLITHDIDEAIKLGDQVAILRVGGRLAQVGTPQELLDEPADEFVEGFVGRDRGYRSLSFLTASGLSLGRVKVVRDPLAAEGDEPVLVLDSEAKPLGWADRSRPGHILGLGSVFDPEHDTLRVALDSALTSPVGLAVGVAAANGRFLGVVDAAYILSQVTESRAGVADAVSARQEAVTLAPASDADSEESLADTDETTVRSADTDETTVRSAVADETTVRSADTDERTVRPAAADETTVRGRVEADETGDAESKAAVENVADDRESEDDDRTAVHPIVDTAEVEQIAPDRAVSADSESRRAPDPTEGEGGSVELGRYHGAESADAGSALDADQESSKP